MKKNVKKSVKKKRKLNYQKLFCFASFIFILVCILWYGGRLIYFYQDSKKTITEEATTLARTIKTANNTSENFKQVNKDYYFTGDVTTNYVSYSNLLWRIVKINEDNSILLITDNAIGNLAYGNNENTYKESNLINWLNYSEDNANSGIFENMLNQKEKYLTLTSTCNDTIDDIENITCENKENSYYLGLLSIEDYLHTGGNNGFINNERYNYLANKNENNDIWYITDEGKLDTTTGEDILGIKATITLSSKLNTTGGTGTETDPYKFEETNGLIGSYVKLDNDTWRIYEENNNIIKLVLQDTITENNEKLKYNYSKNTYYHNDTIYGSLAYYLNNTYYNNLSYKDLIIENTYTNGYYGSDNDYQYQEIATNTIETKVSIPSLDNIILNDTLDGYFTNTGLSKNSSLIYIQKEKGIVSTENVTTENYIVPCISINKENLTVGTGDYTDPYRTE